MVDIGFEGTLVPLLQGGAVVRAADVSSTGDAGTRVQTVIDNLNESILQWKFSTSTAGTNPGATFLALDNAAKDNATTINFNTTSNVDSARFDEALQRLRENDGLFIQSRTATNKSIFYRVTGTPTLDGTRVDVPVSRDRDQGGEFVADEILNVKFFFKGGGGALIVDETVQINATSSTTFASSLSGVTPARGDAYRVSTAGTPFDGNEAYLAVGDVLAAVVNSPSTTDIADWGVLRRPAQLLAVNVDTNYRRVIEGTSQGGNTDLTSLESKVNALFPLTPDVAVLNDWADIYNPTRTSSVPVPVAGYSSFIDYRSDSDRFESTGITYDATGTDIVEYSGLTDDLHRVFGFKVTSASDQVLLTMFDGSTDIPLVDMLTTGRFRINNYTPAHAQDEVLTGQFRQATLSSGTGTISVGGADSTYTIPEYPANTTAQSRTADFEYDVLVNGNDTFAGGFIVFETPDTDVAQAERTVSHQFNLGPTEGNRRIDVVVTYEFRVSGSDLLVDVNLQSAPSDVTLRISNPNVDLNYTASVVIARVDDWQVLNDGAGDYTFTGGNELLIAFHPFVDLGFMNAVPAARNDDGTTTQLNDVNTPVPPSVPNFSNVRIPDDIEFRAFLPDHFLVHSNLVSLLGDSATKWVYNLNPLQTITTNAVTEPIDLAAGTTLDGDTIKVDVPNTVHQATGRGTASGELVQNLVLPAGYLAWTYLHVTELRTSETPDEWRFALIDTQLLASSNIESTDVIRIQGNSDFTWTQNTRTLVSQAGQTIWRAVLIDL